MSSTSDRPSRGQRKKDRTRSEVVDRFAELIGQGNDLQDMSLEKMLCGTRGVKDGVINPSTMYTRLEEAGEQSHRGEGLREGSLFARWLQEDDPASYTRWQQLLADRAGRPADEAEMTFEQARQHIGTYPPLSRASTLSSDLEHYQRKLASLARYNPDMFLCPIDDDGELVEGIMWHARYLETARYLTLLAGRARDTEPDWGRAAKIAATALRVFFNAVAASAQDGWLRSSIVTRRPLPPERLVLQGYLMPEEQVMTLAGEWAYALVRNGLAPSRAVDRVRGVSPYFPLMPPGDLETWAALARLEDPGQDAVKQLRWVPGFGRGFGQLFQLEPPERRERGEGLSSWEALALCRCWVAVHDRARDSPSVERLRALALSKLSPDDRTLWRYTLTGRLSDKFVPDWALERAADAVSEELELLDPPGFIQPREIGDDRDEEDFLRPEVLGIDASPQLPVMLLHDLLELDPRPRASLHILYDTLQSLKDGFVWQVLPTRTRQAWHQALRDKTLKTALDPNPNPQVARLTAGARRLNSAIAAGAVINDSSLGQLEEIVRDLETIVAERRPNNEGDWSIRGRSARGTEESLLGTRIAGVLFPHPDLNFEMGDAKPLGLVAVEMQGHDLSLDTMQSALAQAVRSRGGQVVMGFQSSTEQGQDAAPARWRAEGTAFGL